MLWTTAAISARSPSTKKRGSTGRTSRSWVAMMSVLLCPTRVSAVTARASIVQVVRLSGSVTWTCAFPSAPVVTFARQNALSGNSRRTLAISGPPPPPPPPLPPSANWATRRSTLSTRVAPVCTPSPR